MKWFLSVLFFLLFFVAFIWFSVGKDKFNSISLEKEILRLKTTQRVIDENADGLIDSAEISKSKERLLLYDKNKDGRLSIEELGGSKATKEKLREFAIVKAIDVNEDGRFSKKELEQAAIKILALDSNGDGKINAQESSGK